MGWFAKEKMVNRVYAVPVSSIHSNPDQPRRIFEKDELLALSASIAENGLLQPISLMREENGSYRIIAGERRFLACKMLGMEEIPAIVCSVGQGDAAVLALIENIQRSNLNYLEEAAAIAKLMEKLSLTQEQMAKRLGRSQSAVANKLRLLRLSPEVQAFLLEKGLSERHARALLRLPEEQIAPAASAMAEQSMNVAQAERYVESLLQPLEILPPEKSDDGSAKGKKILVVKDIRIFTNTIHRAIETMKDAGIAAYTEKVEHEDYLEYVVRIPKSVAYRRKSS